MTTQNIIIGRLGEEIAVKYLLKQGYTILERNYKTSFAELDIIAIKDEILAIIEVKTRKDFNVTEASSSVNYLKQNKIKKITNHYIMENRLYDLNIRFDIIECYWNLKQINHIENAFW